MLFNEYIEINIDSLNINKQVKDALKYALVSNGKLIRPNLFLSFFPDKEKYYDLALAIEVIHVFSLIHDDLPAIDNDDYRRGKLTLHKKFDEATAILIGDALLNYAYELIVNAQAINDSEKVKIIKIISQKTGINQGMIHGQFLDIYQITNNIEQIKNCYFEKTGALLSAAMLMANVIIKQYNEEKLEELAYKIGLLYQIQDDYFDCYGNFEEIGKTIGSDLKNDKKTYVNYFSKNELEKIIYDLKEQIQKDIIDLKLKKETIQLIELILVRKK